MTTNDVWRLTSSDLCALTGRAGTELNMYYM